MPSRRLLRPRGGERLAVAHDALAADRQAAQQPQHVVRLVGQLERRVGRDDERVAGRLLRNRAAQGYGPARIRMELKTHGLSDAAIRQLLDECEVDWNVSAMNKLRRH